MKRKNEDDDLSFLNDKVNPFYYVMGVIVLIAAIVAFCYVVWTITHANQNHLADRTPSNTVAGTQPDEIINASQESSSEESSSEEQEESEAEEKSDPVMDESVGMAFTECNETVTSTNVVNLRSEPSTEGGNTTVVGTLSNGTMAVRTGINEAFGWSRLEYNGQVVYAASQYIMVVE